MKIAIPGTGNLGLSIAEGLVVSNAFTTLYLTRRKTCLGAASLLIELHL